MRKWKWAVSMTLLFTLLCGVVPAYADGESAGKQTLVLYPGTNKSLHNGTKVTASQTIVSVSGTLYAPVSLLASRYKYTFRYDKAADEVVVTDIDSETRWKAGKDTYKRSGRTVKMTGKPFMKGGSLLVPVRAWAMATGSQLSNGKSTVTLKWTPRTNVLPPPPPNAIPVAYFTTDKSSYKIGEPVTFADLSTDADGELLMAQWVNKEPAYFEPGEQLVTLSVNDTQGATSTISQSITITSEVMNTREQFTLRYTPVGEKFPISASGVLDFEKISYSFADSNRKLIASDQPEMLVQEGILYSDMVDGDARVFVYHESGGTIPLKVYMAITNEDLLFDTKVMIGTRGVGGPNEYGAYTGKVAAERYWSSYRRGQQEEVYLLPGETKLVARELDAITLKQIRQVVAAHADITSSSPVRLTLFAVGPDKDPLAALPGLTIMPSDGRHLRGTFPSADRTIEIPQLLGERKQRIIFGSETYDPGMTGTNVMTGETHFNTGNYGVVYHLKLNLKANSVLALNARGGELGAGMLINGEPVNACNGSYLKYQDEACVLYRTGPSDQTLDISFLTALGSFFPMNFVVLPI